MKKFTSLIILTCLFLIFSVQSTALAQGGQLGDRDCNFISEDGCFAVGYVSVTQSTTGGPGNSGKNPFDVEIFFQDICEAVSQIKINKSPGPPIIIPDDQITDELKTVVFQVNANSFDNKGRLKITIELEGKTKQMVNIVFDESLDCGIIEPLAVELTSFTGLPTKSGINLNWTTASEENNSHFEVERSADGLAFEQIAKVNGHGNSSVTLNYNFTDADPLNGENYYRLRQVDFDGQFAYSKTIVVSSSLSNALQLSMAPNPCRNGNCEVLIRGNRADRQTLLELKDMSGKVVFSKMVQRGAVQLQPDELRDLKGLFILTATSGDEVVHQRVILE